MKIAIIEDELLAVNYLRNLLDRQSIVPVTEMVILRSKKQGIDFFENHSADLIFITAFDEYAMRVFRHFTIDFLLKPFEEEDLHKALQKFISIRSNYDPEP